MSLTGSSPLVYQGFSGCGTGAKLWEDPGRTRVSYARSVDTDPFRRLRDEGFDDERFLDANWRTSLDNNTDVGSDFSFYTSDPSESLDGKTVAGGRAWLSGINDRLHMASSFAVAGAGMETMDGLAQRHEVDFVAVRSSETTVLAKMAYAEADADFAGARSPAAANQRTIDVGAEVHLPDTRLSFGYHRLRDNISLDEAPSRTTDTFAAGVTTSLSEPAMVVPDRLAFRTQIGRGTFDNTDGSDAASTRSGAAGLSLGWGDSELHAGLDFDSAWSQQQGGARQREHSHMAALDIGGRMHGLNISSRLYSRMLNLKSDDEDRAGTDVGWSLAADFEGRGWQSSLRYDVEQAAAGPIAWQWSATAELDALDLFGFEPSNRRLFAYGEIDANVAETGTGPIPAFSGRFVAGYKF